MNALRPSHWMILLAAGVVVLLLFLGRETLTEHEVFAAEPAREMLAGRGWVLQPFAGEYRTKKPPGQSWLIAASLAVTGVRNEWTARLPSALAGIGVACAAAWIAGRLGTSRRGLTAGLMTLTCVGVQQRARLAEADMALALCVAVANAVLLRATFGPARRSTSAFAFWAAIVVGFLIKGPIVLGFTILPAVVAWGVMRFGTKERSAATALAGVAFWWPAVIVGLLSIAAWPALALHTYPAAWQQWRHEVVDRVSGQVGHGDEGRHDPLLTYLYVLPFTALPWVVFALPAAALARRVRLTARPANTLLAAWLVCGVTMLSAIPFKATHYVLPALPPVIVLAALGFDRVLMRSLRRRPPATRSRWAAVALAAWFVPAVVGWCVVQAVVGPRKDYGVAVVDFARQVNALAPAGETIYFYKTGEERTAWYLEGSLRQTTTLPVARPAYLICTADELPGMRAASTVTVLAEAGPFVARQSPADRRLLVRVEPPVPSPGSPGEG